jgi:hypothetical protein
MGRDDSQAQPMRRAVDGQTRSGWPTSRVQKPLIPLFAHGTDGALQGPGSIGASAHAHTIPRSGCFSLLITLTIRS